MNLNQLLYFTKLAELEHMTQTAEKLDISQPSLSYQIAELEKELRLPLFEKTGRNIRLNPYGKTYYSYAKEALSILEQGRQALQDRVNQINGLISLGFIYTMGTYLVPYLAKAFSKVYPDIHFTFQQDKSDNLLDNLASGDLNLAFTSRIDHKSDLIFQAIFEEELVVICSNDHALASRDNISLEDLKDFPFVGYVQGSGMRAHLNKIFNQAGLEITNTIEVEEDHSVLGFVSQGYGLAIIPKIPSISSFPVKSLTISTSYEARLVYLAYNKNKQLSPACRAFIDMCLELTAVENRPSPKPE